MLVESKVADAKKREADRLAAAAELATGSGGGDGNGKPAGGLVLGRFLSRSTAKQPSESG
jgi:hypothetical protein